MPDSLPPARRYRLAHLRLPASAFLPRPRRYPFVHLSADSAFAPPRQPRIVRSLVLPLLMFGMMMLIGYSGFLVSEHTGIGNLRESGARQMALHARGVESEIGKFTFLPRLLEMEPQVAQLLQAPSPARRRYVNHYLDGFNDRSGSRVVYVLDPTGRVQASSNWDDFDSYVDEDLSFRAYFQDAIVGKPGRFYGIGSTIGESGYYLAHGLKHQGKIIGAGVVKVRLEAVEQRWRQAGLQAFVSDENQIIILSSEPAHKLRAVTPLSPARREQLALSLQYHWWALTDLKTQRREPLGPGEELITFPSGERRAPGGVRYLALSQPLADTPWRFTLLLPLEDIRRNATSHGALAAVLFAFLSFLLIAWNERRKVIATRLAAREALQKANNVLEHKIAQRTADLRASNRRLKAEVREREQTELTLRRTQDDLIQAGKLAVIGQMATSIAHELNQPLAALRTLSGNTVRFLERGKLDVASANLTTINQLVDRMGKITASLRSFARRSDPSDSRASLTQAVEAALFLVEPRKGKGPLTLVREFSDCQLAIDQTRLEQILVNLLSNALDAMQGQQERILTLHGEPGEHHYHFMVRDNGHGLPPDTMPRLFEPFFTTKPAAQGGLGLGLTISASLAADAGGSLSARQPDGGGAEFVLTLPCLPTETPPHG